MLPNLGRLLVASLFLPGMFSVVVSCSLPIHGQDRNQLPDWVTFPDREWVKITPAQAGLDARRLEQIVSAANIHGGGTLGVQVQDGQWGAVLTRGGPGWMVISSEDLARFGLLIATGGVWKGRRLIGSEWLRGHAGLDVHVVAGDPETMVSIAKINTKNFPFGQQVGTQGRFSFPKELITGPVQGAGRGSSEPASIPATGSDRDS